MPSCHSADMKSDRRIDQAAKPELAKSDPAPPFTLGAFVWWSWLFVALLMALAMFTTAFVRFYRFNILDILTALGQGGVLAPIETGKVAFAPYLQENGFEGWRQAGIGTASHAEFFLVALMTALVALFGAVYGQRAAPGLREYSLVFVAIVISVIAGIWGWLSLLSVLTKDLTAVGSADRWTLAIATFLVSIIIVVLASVSTQFVSTRDEDLQQLQEYRDAKRAELSKSGGDIGGHAWLVGATATAWVVGTSAVAIIMQAAILAMSGGAEAATVFATIDVFLVVTSAIGALIGADPSGRPGRATLSQEVPRWTARGLAVIAPLFFFALFFGVGVYHQPQLWFDWLVIATPFLFWAASMVFTLIPVAAARLGTASRFTIIGMAETRKRRAIVDRIRWTNRQIEKIERAIAVERRQVQATTPTPSQESDPPLLRIEIRGWTRARRQESTKR